MKTITMLADIHVPNVPQLPVGANPIVKVVMTEGDILDNTPVAKTASSNLKKDIDNAIIDLESLAATVEVSFKDRALVVNQKRKSGRPKGSKNKVKKNQ